MQVCRSLGKFVRLQAANQPPNQPLTGKTSQKMKQPVNKSSFMTHQEADALRISGL
jgi:hypothetical protein